MIKENGYIVRHSGFARLLTPLYSVLTTLGSLFALCAFWQISAENLGIYVLPEPLEVMQRVIEITKEDFFGNISITLVNSIKGTLIAIFFGVGLGWLSALIPAIYTVLRPWNVFLLGTPPIIWVVMAFFWFGTNSAGITIFTVLMSVAPMLFSAGVMSMNTRPMMLHEMARIYELSLFKRIRYVYLPHIVTTLMPAISVAVGMGIKVTVMAELLASNHGIGAFIGYSRETLDTASLVAYVVIAVLIILFLEYAVLNTIRRLVLPREVNEQT